MTFRIEKLTDKIDKEILGSFDAGEDTFTNYLRDCALADFRAGVAVTHLAMDVDSNRILGYITFRIHELTADVIDRHDMPVSRKARKRWKDRYPALLIMKLATTPQSRKQGVGGALLREAFDAAIKTRELIGLWGITLPPFENRQAIINFYGNFGFQYRCSEVGALMWLSVADLIEVMGASAPPVSK